VRGIIALNWSPIMAWKKGPLPKGTYNWGAVVPVGEETGGFYFADFVGDSAILIPSERVVKADEVALYDNSLELPPNCKGRAPA
jgi:hypothetical protein